MIDHYQEGLTALNRPEIIINPNKILNNYLCFELLKLALGYLSKSSRDSGLVGVVKSDAITGERQLCDCSYFDHEYVDQRCEFEDSYSGHVYLPLPNGEYLKMYFYD